ncbi:hypothetical protein [Nonomuraea roseoviolacea]|uniref:Uncharacterized protein n=1 Tax=Nonomuraea roseoviolacea subsp. carminata TaxID=160689 RepID=A0ABT1K370_9ACTN|nr:hypothetical protein [Nonomuraea roseoviolacea]MCP2348067.1 hypothetical protein [Nonomuraea roseoviolacea subsp. carminata]
MTWHDERDLPEGRHRLLKEFVMTEIDRAAEQSRPRRRLLRPAVLAPVLGLAAAAALALPLFVGGGSPAYALTDNPDGTVRVQINELRDADKLEADLRAKGINMVVDYIPQGKKCSPQPRAARFLPDEQAPLIAMLTHDDGEATFVIDPRVIKDGQTGVLEFTVFKAPDGPAAVTPVWARVAEGTVADCTLVDTTEPPLPH